MLDMKKWISILPIILLGFFACNKEEESIQEVVQPTSYLFELKANVEEQLSKVTYDNDETFKWSDNDEISVLFHNGETHKFFTLKTSTGGSASATFTGTVDAGYEIGASDAEGGVHWALFPAAEHSWDFTNHMPIFNIPSETDYTATHFSANIPMQAQGDGANNFSFKNVAGAYKFTFTGMTVSKVKLIVDEIGGNNRMLSGNMPLKLDGSTVYMETKASYGATGSTSVSFIENVVGEKAEFYISCRAWRDEFKPKFTLINMDEGVNKGNIILSKKAKASLGNLSSLNSVIIIPSVAASGDGEPGIIIDGGFDDWATFAGVESPTTVSRLMKITNDSDNIYLYVVSERNSRTNEDGFWGGSGGYYYFDFDLDNNTETGEYPDSSYGKFEALTYLYLFGGTKDEPTIVSSPSGSSSSGISTSGIIAKGTVTADLIYIELAIPRANISSTITAGQTIRVLSRRSKDGNPLEYTYVIK